jgi:RNA polymerase sigma-32 factor
MNEALAFPIPLSLGSLESYIAAVQRFPVLEETEELALARRLHEREDLEAARQLVLSHLRLVVSIARGYLGYGLPHADLIQEGNIGLMKAVKRFDPERGVRLFSFAVHWIKAEIHEYIVRNWRLVKIATTKAQRKLFFNLRSFKQELGSLSAKAVDRVARTLQVKPAEVLEMEARLSGQEIPLEPCGDSEEDDVSAPIHYLADACTTYDQVAELQHEARQAEHLKRALASLDVRSRDIIERRWLAEEEVDGATLQELAVRHGVSAERIRQIENKALQALRKLIEPQ